MSKKSLFAKDILPGDVIRLVYEIEVDKMGDLDTEFPSESDNLFFIKGDVIKGPLHKQGIHVKFAIYGDDRVELKSRKTWWAKLKDRLSSYRPKIEKIATSKTLLSPIPSGVAHKVRLQY